MVLLVRIQNSSAKISAVLQYCTSDHRNRTPWAVYLNFVRSRSTICLVEVLVPLVSAAVAAMIKLGWRGRGTGHGEQWRAGSLEASLNVA